jgi:hypothetical protein
VFIHWGQKMSNACSLPLLNSFFEKDTHVKQPSSDNMLKARTEACAHFQANKSRAIMSQVVLDAKQKSLAIILQVPLECFIVHAGVRDGEVVFLLQNFLFIGSILSFRL